jgi:hypothetical protein
MIEEQEIIKEAQKLLIKFIALIGRLGQLITDKKGGK